MAFENTKPNKSQNIGDVIESTRLNLLDLDSRLTSSGTVITDANLPALNASKLDYEAHKANNDAHGLTTVRANIATNTTEIVTARGSTDSVNSRLSVALNQNGSIKLSTLNNKWINNGDTPTFVTGTSFTVPNDRTKVYIGGVQLRFTVAGNFVYAPVASSSFNAGVTTIVLDPAYNVLSAGVTVVEIGLIAFDNSIANSVATFLTDLSALQGQVTALKFERYRDDIVGKPSASLVKNYVVTTPISIPANATNSAAASAVTATSVATFILRKNGVNFGTFSFAAGVKVATFNVPSATSFIAGDILSVVAPSTQDATLADVAHTITGVLA